MNTQHPSVSAFRLVGPGIIVIIISAFPLINACMGVYIMYECVKSVSVR